MQLVVNVVEEVSQSLSLFTVLLILSISSEEFDDLSFICLSLSSDSALIILSDEDDSALVILSNEDENKNNDSPYCI